MASSNRIWIYLRQGTLIRNLFLASGTLLLAAIVNFTTRGPHRDSLLFVAVVLPGVVAILGSTVFSDRIDSRLEILLGRNVRQFEIVSFDFPEYRFVDAFNAIERQIRTDRTTVLDSQHSEELAAILGGRLHAGAGFPEQAKRVPCLIRAREEAYFPSHRFWVRRAVSDGVSLIVRLRLVEYPSVIRLEVASSDRAYAEKVLTEIRNLSVTQSIYRGQAIDVSLAAGVKDEYGNVDQSGKVKVEFSKLPPVRAEQMVTDPRVWPLIEHSLLKHQSNYQVLRSHGVALKRGFLFYGPPGTGKSFTVRFIASLLPGTTIVYCSGAALHNVSSAFNLARMLKPALVVMEDVDLVFSSRELNPNAGALGDLFDEIDALADDEPVSLILTTNAIDRIESAVKDRPGRVGQCVYFGPPSAELRRRYVQSYLQHHDTSAVDLDCVVKDTDGATQAFLKELVHRALQFAVEGGRTEDARVLPTTGDFSSALAEMRAFDSKSTRAISGFRVDQS